MFSQIALMGNNKVFFISKQNSVTQYPRWHRVTTYLWSGFVLLLFCYLLHFVGLSLDLTPLTSLLSCCATKTLETIRVTGRHKVTQSYRATELQYEGCWPLTRDQLNICLHLSSHSPLCRLDSEEQILSQKCLSYSSWRLLRNRIILLSERGERH